MNKITASLGLLAQTGLFAGFLHAEEKPLNILFIGIDDLKPVLGCYGNSLVKTPNIDRLASRGTIFMNNYCQQAVSGPTRASIMTGMRPDHTRVWDLKTRMRDINPDILSLPQYLGQSGFVTAGIGKIYDSRCVDDKLDEPSWSFPYYKNSDSYYDQRTGEPALNYQLPETRRLIEKYTKEAEVAGIPKAGIRDWVLERIKPATECADVPDNAYNDGANALHAKDILIMLSRQKKPFFFATGFSKPHLPFVAPKKYWDLYDRDKLPLAPFQQHAKDSPDIAYHNSGELRKYSDIPPLMSFTDQKNGIGLPAGKQKELIHGYYAATSYTDAQVGILLDALDSLGLTSQTVIVLWGDHGWHLGDHDLWCKHTNFEQATRTPLVFCAPGFKPGKTWSMSEFVDIFPTLCDLSGVPVPPHLQGKSLVPLMKDPSAKVKEYAISQYPRNEPGKISGKGNTLGWESGDVMGYSLRTPRFRYTLWMRNGFRTFRPFSKDLVMATELYDYQKDPDEKVNVSGKMEYAGEEANLNDKIISFFESQIKK